MPLTNQQITEVENVLRTSLRHKFQSYNPEPGCNAVSYPIVSKDRLGFNSFIHSLNTNFWTSIFEPVALALSATKFKSAQLQATVGTKISSEAHKVIQNIMESLTVGSDFAK